MGDNEAILWAKCGAPASHFYVYARRNQVNRSLASLWKGTSIFWQPFFMSSPSELRVHEVAFTNQPTNRPSVPKLVSRLQLVAPLGVSFSDVHSFNAQVLHQKRPLGFGLWLLLQGKACVLGNIDQRLLHKPADHSWVGSAGRNGRRLVLFLSK